MKNSSLNRRQARFNEEFLKTVEGKRYTHPETKNEVLFESLPYEEQQRYHQRWVSQQHTQKENVEINPVYAKALQSSSLVPNRDPNRYSHVKIDYGGDPTYTKEMIDMLAGRLAKRLGRTPEQLLSDLAGAGGIASHLEMVSFEVVDYNKLAFSGHGKHIKYFDRVFEFRENKVAAVDNEHLSLTEDAPKGLGTKILATQVAAMKESGGKKLKTCATGRVTSDYKGYYVWPMLGYNGKLHKDDVDIIPEEIKEKMKENGAEPPFYVRDLFTFPEGQKWWWNNGSEIDLEFYVQDDSVLQEYVRRKAESQGKTVGQFLHTASHSNKSFKDTQSQKIETPPDLDRHDLEILSDIWINFIKSRKKQSPTMSSKISRQILKIAISNKHFKNALFDELKKSFNTMDYAHDDFSQHLLLRNLHGGDVVDVSYGSDPDIPGRRVTRLVLVGFDSVTSSVKLRGPDGGFELLSDQGQGMPLLYEPENNGAAQPVLQLKRVRSKLSSKGINNGNL